MLGRKRRKTFPFLLLCASFLYAAPSSAFKAPASQPPDSKAASQKAIQQKLISLAAVIQSHEAQLSAVEQDLSQARAEESAILGELDRHNQQLMETIHYLRHATQYSPLLAMLSASKPEDAIHSSMLLRAVTPEIHARNQRLLEKLKALSFIRGQWEDKQNQLRDIAFQYHQERENLDMLLKTRPAPASSPEETVENVPEQISLTSPVAGKIIPTYGNTQPEWASFAQGVLFVARFGAQVVSPLSGTIAFAGNYAKGQGKMVIVETSNCHIVMSGLGSLNCLVGQRISAGEPIGRMPAKQFKLAKSDAQTGPRLYLEVWRQEQTLNPQSILKDKKKES